MVQDIETLCVSEGHMRNGWKYSVCRQLKEIVMRVGVFEDSVFECSVGRIERGERSNGMLLTLKVIRSWEGGTGWRTRS